MEKYTVLARKGAGTFSEVIKAQRISDGKMVAIKKMKAKYKSVEQVAKLREIQALKRLAMHPNIVQLLEVIFDPSSGRLALVFELMDSNLYEYIKVRKTYVPEPTLRLFLYQMVTALAFTHSKGIFHRDIKPENILVLGNILKFADFGSCRGIHSNPPYTEYISTRWYRSPEVIVSDGNYGPPMDVFALGCVFFELIALTPLFPGRNETDQIARIHHVLGTPDKQLLDRLRKGVKNNPLKVDWPQEKGCGLRSLLPRIDGVLMNLLEGMLTYDPLKRFTAQQCLMHPYFDKIRADKPITAPRQELFEAETKKMSATQGLLTTDKVNKSNVKTKSDFTNNGLNIGGNSNYKNNINSIQHPSKDAQQQYKDKIDFNQGDGIVSKSHKNKESGNVLISNKDMGSISNIYKNSNNAGNNFHKYTTDDNMISNINPQNKGLDTNTYNTNFAYRQNQQVKYLNYINSPNAHGKNISSTHEQSVKPYSYYTKHISVPIDASKKYQQNKKNNIVGYNSYEVYNVGKTHQSTGYYYDSPKFNNDNNSSSSNQNTSLTNKLSKLHKENVVSRVIPGENIEQIEHNNNQYQKSPNVQSNAIPHVPKGNKMIKHKGNNYHLGSVNRGNVSINASLNNLDNSYETGQGGQYNLPPIDISTGSYLDTSYTKTHQKKKKDTLHNQQNPYRSVYASFNNPFGKVHGVGYNSPTMSSSLTTGPSQSLGHSGPTVPANMVSSTITGISVKKKVVKRKKEEPSLGNSHLVAVMDDRTTDKTRLNLIEDNVDY